MSKLKTIIKNISPYVVALLVSVFSGWFLLFVVGLIPQSYLYENWQNGRNIDFKSVTYTILNENQGELIDDWTDAMKVDLAYRLNEHSVLTPTAQVYGQDYEYGRYWQGYCIVLRPLLLLFNLSEIRTVYGTALAIVMISLIFILLRRKEYSLVFSMIFAFYMTNIHVALMCLQYFNCYFISILTVIIFLCFPKLYTKNYTVCFFIIGILVNYFDFLTFESLTLSFPLLITEICLIKEETMSKRIKRFISSSFSWFMGYALMFLSKWVLYIVCAGDGALDILISKITERSIGSHGGFSLKEAIILTFGNSRLVSMDNVFTIFVVTMAVTLVYSYLVYDVHRFDICLFAILCALLPILRFAIMKEHSITHAAYAYRALFTFFAAYAYAIIYTCKKLIQYIKPRRMLKHGFNIKKKIT